MRILQLYDLLLKQFGPQGWWPAEKDFEIVVGAVLTQRTNWRNAAMSIRNLKEAGLLEPTKLAKVDNAKLKKLIRPSGFYNQKAKRLKAIAVYVVANGGMKTLKKRDMASVREEMLSMNGFGKETVDSVLSYALDRPVFVVDAYTKRIFERTGLIKKPAEEMSYDEVQDFVEDIACAKPVEFYNEFHALLVRLGKEHCLIEPRCKECPLKKCPRKTKQKVKP